MLLGQFCIIETIKKMPHQERKSSKLTKQLGYISTSTTFNVLYSFPAIQIDLLLFFLGF